MESQFKKGDIVTILPIENIPQEYVEICKTPAREKYAKRLAIIDDVQWNCSPDKFIDGYGYRLIVLMDNQTIELWRSVLSVGLVKYANASDISIDYKAYPLQGISALNSIKQINNKEKLVLQVNKNKSKLKFNFN